MVERGEDIEKQETEHLAREIVNKQTSMISQAIADFQVAMDKCDFYNSLKAYMNIEHFLQRGKAAASELMSLNKEDGLKELKYIETLEQQAYKTAEEKAKNCKCEQREPFRYVTEIPKE